MQLYCIPFLSSSQQHPSIEGKRRCWFSSL